ncbi:F-box domain [Arabidopsis thaliana x Arabidopsis arenosa]|uniref:F-box domain n=1 Tax=Arabidopsis thaliana x Arabidopsis arenosa TaxID=1240361 RepID=A0A8T2ASR1_9BRAS|nr:F-box domain [Arabidopsis thaliana x Arabidopsis arenosa]
MSSIPSLPVDIIIDCIARVPRRYYPTLSLVSKLFRSIIASHQLYVTRSLLDRTECCLFVTIAQSEDYDGGERLYTLLRKSNSTNHHCLVPITSVPVIPTGGIYVAVDSKIFVIGGYNNENLSPTNTLLIDSRVHTAQHLPSMPSEMASSVFNIIDKKIYIRECESGTESETWFSWRPAMKVCKWVCSSVVTPDKIYFKTSKNCFVYDPDEDKWEKDDILNSKMWSADECVIEGIQSCYYLPSLEMLFAYDTKQRVWKGVKGVGRLTDDVFSVRTMSYGGKVFVLLQKQLQEKNEIWCAEIKLERDKEGVVCGNVEWCCCVLEGQWPLLKNCLLVKI